VYITNEHPAQRTAIQAIHDEASSKNRDERAKQCKIGVSNISQNACAEVNEFTPGKHDSKANGLLLQRSRVLFFREL